MRRVAVDIFMQLRTFVLPIKNLASAELEMNTFLRGHRILAVKKEFVGDLNRTSLENNAD